MGFNKIIYLIVETKSRELEASFLLANSFLKLGYSVVISSDFILRDLSIIPPGVVLHKDAISKRVNLFKRLSENGFKVCVHDAEGLVVFDRDRYIEKRISYEAMKYVDTFFCWGQEQYETLIKVIDKKKLKIVGHPRIDLLISGKSVRFDDQNIILVNTHCAACNFLDGHEGLLQVMRSSGAIVTDADLKKQLRLIGYKCQLLKSYKDLILYLSINFPNYKIAVRPHPAENINTWKTFANNLSNVDVNRSFSVHYWIRQAFCVIHTGCTTAIESFISNKLVISYKKVKTDEFDVPFPDSLSMIANNESEVKDYILDYPHSMSNYQYIREKKQKILEKNLLIYSVTSSELIANFVDEEFGSKHAYQITELSYILKFKLITFGVKRLIYERLGWAVNNKFPYTTKDEFVAMFKDTTKINLTEKISVFGGNAVFLKAQKNE